MPPIFLFPNSRLASNGRKLGHIVWVEYSLLTGENEEVDLDSEFLSGQPCWMNGLTRYGIRWLGKTSYIWWRRVQELASLVVVGKIWTEERPEICLGRDLVDVVAGSAGAAAHKILTQIGSGTFVVTNPMRTIELFYHVV